MHMSSYYNNYISTSAIVITFPPSLCSDLASTSQQGFRDQLYNYWFQKYSRSRGIALDSSGWEHVFAGELKGGKVSGFHNWVQFYRQEKSGELEYSSYIQGCEVGQTMSSLFFFFFFF